MYSGRSNIDQGHIWLSQSCHVFIAQKIVMTLRLDSHNGVENCTSQLRSITVELET